MPRPQFESQSLETSHAAMKSRVELETTESVPPVYGADHRPTPASLRGALRASGNHRRLSGSGSDTPSEEDYDRNIRPAMAEAGLRHRRMPPKAETHRPAVIRTDSGVHIIPDDDKGIQDFLGRISRWVDHSGAAAPLRRPGKFRDFVFTHQFSALDRHNSAAVDSPFHGFYTLFWLGVALFVVKISAENWRYYGNPLGTRDIMRTMFSREVFVLLLSDGVMCALTGVTWLIQKLTFRNVVNWNLAGWILQHLWQTIFIVGVIAWTMVRDWPWTHTVFFVLHGIIMLMKQHSYAFYNGHLSEVYKRRQFVVSRLSELQSVDATGNASETEPLNSDFMTPHAGQESSSTNTHLARSADSESRRSKIDQISRAVACRRPLTDEQLHLFQRILIWEIESLTDELKGTASSLSKAYPTNLGVYEHYKWIPLPTVVYELEYPTSDSMSWSYVGEKLVAMVGVLFVMIQISQYSIYPVVMKTLAMKERGDTLQSRFSEFPWILGDLIFPFMMEYLLVWYLIWEIILNILAEITFFGDRRFYDAWWNSVSWDQFARDWNRPVHVFLLRHVHHSSISSLKVDRYTATIITFFLSACVHELVMLCLFKKLRGYLLALQMFQLPLVKLSRTKWLKGRQVLGNLIFWLGIFTGPSLLCSLYLIL